MRLAQHPNHLVSLYRPIYGQALNRVLERQLDVIDTERGLLQAEQSRIEAARSLRFAVADLYEALGTR